MTGTLKSLTLSGTITPLSSDIGQRLSIFAWANARDDVGGFEAMAMQFKPGMWTVMENPIVPLYTDVLITGDPIDVPFVTTPVDLTVLRGTQVYVGYGTSAQDAMDNGRSAWIYTLE